LSAHNSANIGATNELPSIDPLHFGQRGGLGTHLDVADILSLTHQVLQVKCAVASQGIKREHMSQIHNIARSVLNEWIDTSAIYLCAQKLESALNEPDWSLAYITFVHLTYEIEP
jgi:hypothetical protein